MGAGLAQLEHERLPVQLAKVFRDHRGPPLNWPAARAASSALATTAHIRPPARDSQSLPASGSMCAEHFRDGCARVARVTVSEIAIN
jgi:hypothetical protein